MKALDGIEIPEGYAEVVRPRFDTRAVHWVGDAPTSLHGNGAASFDRTTREPSEVTCRLCRSLLARPEPDISGDPDA